MKWNDLATAAFLTAVGVLWIWKGLQIPFPSFARIARVGPAHYPVALAVLLIILSLTLAYQALRRGGTETGGDDGEGEEKRTRTTGTLLIGFVVFLLYLLAVPYAGFIAATAAFSFVFVLFTGRSLVRSLAAAVAIPLAVWLVFVVWLKIIFPKGPWGF